jgi:hypothetical protein
MPNDDDILTANVPDPDAEPTASEKAHAKTFADLVDRALTGRTPPAMSADDRALLEVATVIRAASGNVPLAPGKQRSIVEDALRQAVGGNPTTSMPGVTAITSARSRRLPWVIAATSSLVAAAAIVMLLVRTPKQAAPVATEVPATWKSRPTDALIGAIPREQAGAASARIDTIFADRRDGYRERRLSRGGKR